MAELSVCLSRYCVGVTRNLGICSPAHERLNRSNAQQQNSKTAKQTNQFQNINLLYSSCYAFLRWDCVSMYVCVYVCDSINKVWIKHILCFTLYRENGHKILERAKNSENKRNKMTKENITSANVFIFLIYFIFTPSTHDNSFLFFVFSIALFVICQQSVIHRNTTQVEPS